MHCTALKAKGALTAILLQLTYIFIVVNDFLYFVVMIKLNAGE